MEKSSQTPSHFRFGPFQLDASTGELAENGDKTRLHEQSLKVLLALLAQPGELVTREELVHRLWRAGTFVDFDRSLNKAVNKLREALSDSPVEPRFIETLPRRGYRFIAPVTHNGQADLAVKVKTLTERQGRLRSLPVREIAAAVTAATIALIAYWVIHTSVPRHRSLSVSRLTTSGRVEHAAISPDGKYLTYSENDGNAQSLWVREIATVSSMQLQPAASVSYKSLVFSADGTYVYYTRSAPDTSSELFRLPMVGGTPQKLLPDVPGKFSISPDGRSLSFVRWDDARGESALVVAGADGSGERKLATRHRPMFFNWEEGASWSPDGKLLAVVEVEDKSGPHCWLLVVAVENGSEKMKTKPYGHMLQPQWLGDGRGLIAPIEAPHLQLWQFSYPQAEAERINYDPMRYTEVSLSDDPRSIVAVQLDLLSGIWVGPANDPERVRPVTRGHFIANHGLGWTPAGEILFWTSAADTHDFVQMRPDGTDQRILPLRADYKMMPEVCPDGRTLLFTGLYSGIWTLLRGDLSGSKLEPLAAGAEDSTPRCSLDSKWVVYLGSGKLWKMPVSGGAAISLTDKPCDGASISHDGHWIACRYWPEGASSPRLAIISFAGSWR